MIRKPPARPVLYAAPAVINLIIKLITQSYEYMFDLIASNIATNLREGRVRMACRLLQVIYKFFISGKDV